MKKIAIMCAVLLSIACFMTAFAASSSKTPPVKGGIPEGTKIYAAETTEIEVPAEQKKKAEKATSMDLVLILDKSGSMYGLEKDTIGGFNAMLEKQKKEFENIVKVLAEKYGIKVNEKDLYLEANKWEISHGGLSGRTATQFINYMLGKES